MEKTNEEKQSGATASATRDKRHDRKERRNDDATKVNLDESVRISLPRPDSPLKPARFETDDGRGGWVTSLPGSKPIATPAYDNGMLFVGGGYGSYEFYGLDAGTGEVVWRTATADDGPTAAVVEDGLVAFNTESCSVIVCRADTGSLVWQEWLGDPLMSQPAVDKGKLFLAYPAGQRCGKPPVGQKSHRMLCADLFTGRHVWEQEITGDIITAPVINDDQVFFTCFDGTAFCLDAENGGVQWRERTESTSAPLVVDDEVVMTEKIKRGRRSKESMLRRGRYRGEHRESILCKEAAFLDYDSDFEASGLSEDYSTALDSSVGFAEAPQAANLYAARNHVGVSRVAEAWAYQGSRASYGKGKYFQAGSGSVDCVGGDSGESWKTEFTGKDVDLDDQIFLPASMGRDYLYLCSRRGHLVSVNQDNGSTGFCYSTGHGMSFQPCLAAGSVYAGTNHGGLVCLETGGDDASGWHMWGGNAQHNKTV